VGLNVKVIFDAEVVELVDTHLEGVVDKIRPGSSPASAPLIKDNYQKPVIDYCRNYFARLLNFCWI